MILSRRALLVGTAGAAALATGFHGTAAAKAPFASAQVAGAIRRKVGSIEITALLDGYVEMPPELFHAESSEAAKLAAAEFQPVTPRYSPVNAYLVNLGERLVLIDTGGADSQISTLGRLPEALAAAGVEPGQIDAVLLSHMHPDHIGGAVTASGERVFSNAELIVPEADFSYWYDDGYLSQAPDFAKPFFTLARKGASAYSERLTKISGDAVVFGTIKAVSLPGHTPGHVGYTIESDGEALFIWADAIHHAAYQFKRPDWSAAFDIDATAAAATRKKTLDRAAADRLLVAGMHLPFPGFGHVEREAEGYHFVAAEWPYLP
ncbi:glyoxylase-like metal-dependent hydrolase (beta-lactamase superfamily II) [Rhizobium sullae]|uniref:Glyoxylase-like metal-dependent hydrolase (Beta-lactamase superfamily II) n=2 Tax=Rhizobium sullae TaxID=50338 RepID=A0A4R3Q1N0_RHISU|nr:glyoxylase-like metal-dependent hydrolase (beta-lactamase superfamily II) [Rhizobium sullae]